MGGTAIAANHYLITKTSQIKPSVLKALKAPGAAGKRGASGAQGVPGSEGKQGKEGVSGKEGAPGKNGATSVVVRFGEGSAANAGVGEAVASCTSGERATGGGPQLWNGGDAGTTYITSMPEPSGTGETPTSWRVQFYNASGGAQTVHAYVVCAAP
jgi:hypothetical protein